MVKNNRKKRLSENKRLFSESSYKYKNPDEDVPAIMLVNVTKDYSSKNNGETNSLREVNITIKKGEFVFIIGDSGAGKSTLLKLLMREISPTKGKVYVNGKNLKRLKHSQVAKHRRNVGMVFQDFRLLKDRSVYENVAFAMQIVEKEPQIIKETVPKMLDIVGLSDKEKAYPKELSGGEQQRVALARALVNEPIMILADEPTGNLDPKNSWEIMNLLEEVNKNGTTVVVVTHNIEIVRLMNKRVIELKNGEVAGDWINGVNDENSNFSE